MSIVRSNLTESEDFTVTVAGASLTVRVKRHHAARRYRLRYDPLAGQLRLTLPPRQRLGPARQWVTGQSDWIERQIAARPSGGTRVAPGTLLPWRDGSLRIQWDRAHSRTPHIVGDQLIVGGEHALVGLRVRRWVQAQARADFSERTRAMAAAERLPLASISIGDPRSRWGSCSASGAIRYNWRLALAPDDVRHAIVAHEVAHLAHMNHGPYFHALANRLGGAAVPRSKLWLKANGAMLHALMFDV